MKKITFWHCFKIFLLAALIALCVIAIYIYGFRTPQADRDWVDYAKRASQATVTAEAVTITNVRDWQYNEHNPTDQTWIDSLALDPREIKEVWFLLEPFSAVPVVGHSFLSFEFNDGQVISFSIEARRENGEDYSTIQGLFNEYELKYAWGTERDFITRRLYMHQHPLYLYRLNISHQDGVGVFKTLAQATDTLAKQPRFYNTLAANCTNVLAKTINERYPKSIPYDLAWNFPGLSDRFLVDKGFIAATGTIQERRAAASLDTHKEGLKAYMYSDPRVFSREVRRALGY